MKITRIRCNGKDTEMQAQTRGLFFGWQLASDRSGARQSAYRVRVLQDAQPVWDTGKRAGEESRYIRYEGPSLVDHTAYTVAVTAWDELDRPTEEKITSFETGMHDDWDAAWIGSDRLRKEPFDRSRPFYCADDFRKGVNEYYLPPVPYFRRGFLIGKPVRSAKLYVSAFGLVQVKVNGQEPFGELFIPGLSYYPERVYAKSCRVEANLRQGENVLAVRLGDGWYAGYMGLSNREVYGSRARFMLRLEIEYEDGSREHISSDDSWRCGEGGLREADLFQGECFDAGMEPEGWELPGFDDSSWVSPDIGAEYELTPQPHPGDPVAIHGEQRPDAMVTMEDGRLRLDFDHYIYGVLCLRFAGTAKSQITIRHAEILTDAGELYLDGNRSARTQDRFILKGEGEETFCPIFTCHGFRHAMLRIEGNAKLLEAKAIQIGTRLRDETAFSCSSPVVNRVFEMIRNTEKSNLLETPMDCCARDERLGWGMEGHHFMFAMGYMNDMESMYRKWSADIWDGQHPDGGLEPIAPPVRMKDIEPFVGDLQTYHGIMMVWSLLHFYGDTAFVREHYAGLKKFFAFCEQNSDRHIRYATSRDWLDLWEENDRSDFDHGAGESSDNLLGTAYYILAVNMMIECAQALGEAADAEKYGSLRDAILEAFRRNFIQWNGRLRYQTQGDYLMALACGAFQGEDRIKAIEFLADKLTERGRIFWRGGTPSTSWFLETLKDCGRRDLANRFLVSEDFPSLGYMAARGFDTVWERWDGIWTDGTLHPQPMNAFSHIGFTVAASYLIRGLAGIDTLGQGFKKILICPGPSEEITACEAVYHSGYGPIRVKWTVQGEGFSIEGQIPVGTDAVLVLPCKAGQDAAVLEGAAGEMTRTEEELRIDIASGRFAVRIG